MVRQQKPDRFLIPRDGVYYYWRRVPKSVALLDERAPFIRMSLKTDDLAKARAQRDLLEVADNMLWGSLIGEGSASAQSLAAYQVARAHAESLGFTYRSAFEVAQLPLPDIHQRFLAIKDERTPVATEAAALGGVEQPKVKVTEAFKMFCEEIRAAELAGKSEKQREQWKKVKNVAVKAFISVVGSDMDMVDITRDHGRQFYQHWVKKLAPENGVNRKSASLGKRRMGDMRILYGEYFKHIGDGDRQNPFDGLTFNEKFKTRRPPFEIEFVQDKILKPGTLAGLNAEARAIVFVLIETGARGGEICNLHPEVIKLNDKVPHILIQPRLDPEDPREIKTTSSIRRIPLVGVALEAMKKFPNGFPNYKENEGSFSATARKFFSENSLFPTKKHVIYSFRHTFEDRMKEAKVDFKLREILMGHALEDPKYGSGGSLKLYQDELLKIVYPFDMKII
jgi:integrase